MKTVRLANSELVALVDDGDYELVSRHSWYVFKQKGIPKYAATGIKKAGRNQTILMHRLLLGAKGRQIVDHRNLNGFDNQRGNLRFCSHTENLQNRASVEGSSSKYKGVYWSGPKQRWRARIIINKIAKFLGWFRSEVEAALAYDKAARNNFGAFARLNFTEGDLIHGCI